MYAVKGMEAQEVSDASRRALAADRPTLIEIPAELS
jgi:hypothetical protein